MKMTIIKILTFLVVGSIVVGFFALISSIGKKGSDQYEAELNNALSKPYNDLNKSERDMVDKYVEWEVENSNN